MTEPRMQVTVSYMGQTLSWNMVPPRDAGFSGAWQAQGMALKTGWSHLKPKEKKNER